MKILRIFAVISLFALMACSEAFKGEASKTAPVDPNKTLLPNIGVTQDGNITLSKNALEQEFLLQASIIDHSNSFIVGTPNFYGIQSRIVYFIKKEKSIFMMESTKGYLASDEMPSEKIVTSFEIKDENDEMIAFDFNSGMQKIFVVGDWYASDFGAEMTPQIAIDSAHSFVKEARQLPKKLVIQQMAQIEWGPYLFPTEVLYYLEPYQENKNFTPIKNPGFDRVGFFETHPLVRKDFGTPQTHITKWDIKKPIVFSIADNAPQEYIEAIKEGVLYWNKVFGGGVVRAEMAPKGVRAPNPDYNIIQWITNHHVGFAYADAQMDPRTGETLHGQIFFATSHPQSSLERLKEFEVVKKEPKDSKNPKEDKTLKAIGLNGFSSNLLCQYPDLKEELLYDIYSKAPSETALKMTLDYVRNTIAHEVGHVLGLRHNFAASQSSQLAPKAIYELFDLYVKTGELGDHKRPSSSVMDYFPFRERILNGHYIGMKEGDPLPYDAMAIQWAYYGQPLDEPLEETLFCTDSDTYGWWGPAYSDCAKNDGAHPLLDMSEVFKQLTKNLPESLARSFVAAKTYFDDDYQVPVEEVALDAEGSAQYLASLLEEALMILRDPSPSLLVSRKIPVVTDVNEQEFAREMLRWINKAVTEGAGIATILEPLANHAIHDTMKNYSADFNELMKKPAFAEIFTASELYYMKRSSQKFFKLLEEKLPPEITKTLSYPPSQPKCVWDFDVPICPPKREFHAYLPIADLKGLENVLADWAQYIITEGADNLPVFDGDHRLTATQILDEGQGPIKNWQKENREKILSKLLSQLEKRFGLSFDSIDPEKLSSDKKEAYELELQIVNALKNAPPQQPIDNLDPVQ